MSVLFADIKTPYIDTLTTRRVLSPAVKENIFQGLFTKPDEAVTEQFADKRQVRLFRVAVLADDFTSSFQHFF